MKQEALFGWHEVYCACPVSAAHLSQDGVASLPLVRNGRTQVDAGSGAEAGHEGLGVSSASGAGTERLLFALSILCRFEHLGSDRPGGAFAKGSEPLLESGVTNASDAF